MKGRFLMLGIITLLITLTTTIGFTAYQLMTNNPQSKQKHMLRIGLFLLFSILILTGVYQWGFRWIGLFGYLAILCISSIYYFVKQPLQKPFKKKRVIVSSALTCILLVLLMIPSILFPQFKPIQATGTYDIDSTVVTIVDENHVDPYSLTNEQRKLSVQFWYPMNQNGRYPLLVFSHGSFGFRGSNLSTFENLASHGYIVASIDHSYHSFFAKHSDGSSSLVNQKFLNDAVAITNGDYDERTTYELTHEWLTIRSNDMNTVIDSILAKTDMPEAVTSILDKEKIGLFGHSLGGATAAQLGRERSDIDSVIVVDGTMIGEEISQGVLLETPYPVSLLNLYNEDHYEEAKQLGLSYNNRMASHNGVDAHEVVIRESGHLNFTDLPMFSPILASMLGTGSVDGRYCIETMNQIILDFFDHTLKNKPSLNLRSEY